jgi:hypothetical protein
LRMSLETEFLLLGWGLLGAIVVAALCARRERSRRQWPLRGLLDTLAVIFAACAFAASAWQGWVARDVEKRQLRAYMIVDPIGPKNFVANSAPSVGVRVTARGQTPAYNVSVVSSIAVLPYPASEGRRSQEEAQPKETTKTILGQGQWVDSTPTLSYAPNNSQLDVIKASKDYRVYTWGKVNYTDAFDQDWKNRFCYSLDASDASATTFEPCPTGNCADAQCDRNTTAQYMTSNPRQTISHSPSEPAQSPAP